jgi:hypothetical protein
MRLVEKAMQNEEGQAKLAAGPVYRGSTKRVLRSCQLRRQQTASCSSRKETCVGFLMFDKASDHEVAGSHSKIEDRSGTKSVHVTVCKVISYKPHHPQVH